MLVLILSCSTLVCMCNLSTATNRTSKMGEGSRSSMAVAEEERFMRCGENGNGEEFARIRPVHRPERRRHHSSSTSALARSGLRLCCDTHTKPCLQTPANCCARGGGFWDALFPGDRQKDYIPRQSIGIARVKGREAYGLRCSVEMNDSVVFPGHE